MQDSMSVGVYNKLRNSAASATKMNNQQHEDALQNANMLPHLNPELGADGSHSIVSANPIELPLDFLPVGVVDLPPLDSFGDKSLAANSHSSQGGLTLDGGVGMSSSASALLSGKYMPLDDLVDPTLGVMKSEDGLTRPLISGSVEAMSMSSLPAQSNSQTIPSIQEHSLAPQRLGDHSSPHERESELLLHIQQQREQLLQYEQMWLKLRQEAAAQNVTLPSASMQDPTLSTSASASAGTSSNFSLPSHDVAAATATRSLRQLDIAKASSSYRPGAAMMHPIPSPQCGGVESSTQMPTSGASRSLSPVSDTSSHAAPPANGHLQRPTNAAIHAQSLNALPPRTALPSLPPQPPQSNLLPSPPPPAVSIKQEPQQPRASTASSMPVSWQQRQLVLKRQQQRQAMLLQQRRRQQPHAAHLLHHRKRDSDPVDPFPKIGELPDQFHAGTIDVRANPLLGDGICTAGNMPLVFGGDLGD